MRVTTLGALRLVDRARWEQTIRAALAEYRPGEAAKRLGVSVRQLRNWARELEIAPAPSGAAKKDARRS